MKFSNASFGLEHPLVTSRNLDVLASKYEALGFDLTPMTRHPWGTCNRLAMMEGNFIELISVGDPALIASEREGGHNFGAHIMRFLEVAEGVSMLALHSTNIEADILQTSRRDLEPDARIRFHRDVTLPDGSSGQAIASLATYMDPRGPALSHFLCQQHRPEMVFDHRWRSHRNSARRIAWCAYASPTPGALRARFTALFGDLTSTHRNGGFTIATAGGVILVLTVDDAAALLGSDGLPELDSCAYGRMVSIGVEVDELERAAAQTLNHQAVLRDDAIFVPAQAAGNVQLVLFEPTNDPLSRLAEGV